MYEDGALTSTVSVVEARVEGTWLISFLAKPFYLKGLIMNVPFNRSFIQHFPFFTFLNV